MESVGKRLKAARENRGMSVSDVAKETLMQPYMVSAIENDDFSVASAPLYARGFIKLYAECAGIDPAPLLADYDALSAQKAHGGKPRRKKESSRADDDPAPRRAPKPAKEKIPRESRISLLRDRLKSVRRIRIPKPGFSPRAGFRALLSLVGKIDMSVFSRIQLPRPNVAAAGKAAREKLRWLARRLPAPTAVFSRFRLTAGTRRLILLVILVLALLMAGAYGLRWYFNVTRPRIFDSRFIQPSPEPYIDAPLEKEPPGR